MDQNQTRQRQLTNEQRSLRLVWALVALTAVITVGIIVDGYIRGRWSWDGTGFNSASLWDWLDLLIVPLVLGVGGIWLNRTQRQREIQAEEQRRRDEQRIEEQRRQREFEVEEKRRQNELELQEQRWQYELEVEEQRAQDIALQTYLDQMGSLLLHENLRNSREADAVRTLARARTLSVLGRLRHDVGRKVGPRRKRSIVRFLHDTRLIDKGQRLVDLRGANLEGADLKHLTLTEVDLRGIFCRGGDLSSAYLSNTDLRQANLDHADLNEATLRGVNLGRARLTKAQLKNTILNDANLDFAFLGGADLSHAKLNGASISANLSRACLHAADMTDANLLSANLADADLKGSSFKGVLLFNTNLSGADLKGTILINANLRNARGLTQAQVDQAIGDDTTRLPDYIQRPETWSNGSDISA